MNSKHKYSLGDVLVIDTCVGGRTVRVINLEELPSLDDIPRYYGRVLDEFFEDILIPVTGTFSGKSHRFFKQNDVIEVIKHRDSVNSTTNINT